MPYNYELKMTVRSTSEIISLCGEFDKEDWERLEEFAGYTDELLKTNLVQSGFPASLKMSYSSETGMSSTVQLPPSDDLTVFLHKFRPIGLQKESTSFLNICSVLGKELDHPYFRNMIKEQRIIYTGKRLEAMFQMRSNGVLLNSESVLQSWLNGYEYHRSKDERKFLEELHTLIPFDATKVLFIHLLCEKTYAIHNIAVLIQVILGKQKSLKGQISPPS